MNGLLPQKLRLQYRFRSVIWEKLDSVTRDHSDLGWQFWSILEMCWCLMCWLFPNECFSNNNNNNKRKPCYPVPCLLTVSKERLAMSGPWTPFRKQEKMISEVWVVLCFKWIFLSSLASSHWHKVNTTSLSLRDSKHITNKGLKSYMYVPPNFAKNKSQTVVTAWPFW